MMKVLQIHNHYKIPGGECSVVEQEYKLLSQAGFQVHQYLKHSSELDNLSLIGKTAALFSIPFNKSVATELARVVEQFKPDVAHVHNVFPALSPSVYSALHGLQVPVVQTLHNYRFLCPNGSFFRQGEVCELCLGRGVSSAIKYSCVRDSKITSVAYAKAIHDGWKNGLFHHAITRYIALNPFVKSKMEAGGIDPGKIDICGNFIWQADTDVQQKEDYILYLGRLSPEKGVRMLLQAVKLLPDVHLKIAGTGPLEEEVKTTVASCANMDYLGFVSGEEKDNLVRKAKCMIVPSQWYENFPISVVESMSMGTPVVASRIGGLADLIKPKLNGFLFEAGNPADLQRAIGDCMASLAKDDRLATSTLHYARSEFSASTHLQGLTTIYQRAKSDKIAK